MRYFNHNEFRDINTGAVKTFSIKLFGMGVGYLITLLIARYYTPETVGNFFSAFLLMEFVIVLSLSGMGTAVVVLVSRNNHETKSTINAAHFSILRKALICTLPLATLGSTVLNAFSNTIAVRIFHSQNLSQFISIMALGIVPVATSRIIAQYLRGCKNIFAFSIINFLLLNIAFCTALPIFHLLNFGLGAVPYAYLTASIFMACNSIYFVHRQGNRNGSIRETLRQFQPAYFSKTSLNPIITDDNISLHHLTTISKPIFFADILEYLKSWSGMFFVGIFLTQHDVGIYGIGTKLAGFVGLFGLAYSAIIMPRFGEEFRHRNWAQIEAILRYSAKMLTFFTSFSIIALLLVGKIILGYLGPDYQSAFLIIVIFCIGHLLKSFLGGGSYLLQAINKQKQFTLLLAMNTILSIILPPFLIPRYGLNGAALSEVFFTLGMTLSLFLYIKRVVAIHLASTKEVQLYENS